MIRQWEKHCDSGVRLMSVMGAAIQQHKTRIFNKCWFVRHYVRGGRMSAASIISQRRQDAIAALGLVLRDAFNDCQETEFEDLLATLINGLSDRDEPLF